MKKKLALHLTVVHPHYDVRVYRKEVCSLSAAGYRVMLVVPVENGELAGNGIIEPLPLPKSRFQRVFVTSTQIYQRVNRLKPVLCHIHDPELLPAALLMKSKGIKIIYDAHEDYSLTVLRKRWIPRLFQPLTSKCIAVFERTIAARLDAIVAATPAIATKFPSSKTTLVQNFPIFEELRQESAAAFELRPKRFSYVGRLTQTCGVTEMVDAISLLKELPGAQLHLAGTFRPETLFDEMTRKEGWNRVTYHGQISRPAVSELLGSSLAGLVTLHPTPNHMEAQPTKLYEYMAAGLPVIVTDIPLWRSFVERYGCGLVVDPLKPQEIAGAMKWINENRKAAAAMGQRGQRAVAKHFRWETESQKLAELYQRLIGAPSLKDTLPPEARGG